MVDTTKIEDPPAPPPASDDKPLGPEGEKALEIWKERAKAAEKEAKRVTDLEAELAKHREDAMSEQEKAIEQARREAAEAARSEVMGDTTRRLFKSELKAVASGDLTVPDGDDKTKTVRLADPSLISDPDVALRLLGLDEIPLDVDGDIDSEAISAAVTAFVAAKPYLAAGATPPAGSADQGSRTPPTSKTLDEQIAEAEAAGDFQTAIRLKNHKIAALPRP